MGGQCAVREACILRILSSGDIASDSDSGMVLAAAAWRRLGGAALGGAAALALQQGGGGAHCRTDRRPLPLLSRLDSNKHPDDEKVLGVDPSGKSVVLRTLKNGAMRVRVMDWGATITSVRVPDKDGVVGEVALGRPLRHLRCEQTAHGHVVVALEAHDRVGRLDLAQERFPESSSREMVLARVVNELVRLRAGEHHIVVVQRRHAEDRPVPTMCGQQERDGIPKQCERGPENRQASLGRRRRARRPDALTSRGVRAHRSRTFRVGT